MAARLTRLLCVLICFILSVIVYYHFAGHKCLGFMCAKKEVFKDNNIIAHQRIPIIDPTHIGGGVVSKATIEPSVDVIHLVIAIDKSIFPTVLPLLVSIKTHNKNPVVIHIVVHNEDMRELKMMISCGFPIPDNKSIDYGIVLPQRIPDINPAHVGEGVVSKATIEPSADVIHLVIAVDKSIFPAVLPLLVSIKTHNKNPVVIHIVVRNEDMRELNRMISCGFPIPDNIEVDIVELRLPESIKKLIYVKKDDIQYLTSLGNFVRFYFDQLFPSLEYILYIDVDTVVRHDLTALWKRVISSDKLLVVAEREKRKLHMGSRVGDSYRKRYGIEMDMSRPSFNAGVLGINLDKWRRKNVTREVIFWMSENRKKGLWQLGTQPLVCVIGYGDWEFVQWRWNVDSLGIFKSVSSKNASEAYILHWNGKGKPWLGEKSHYKPKFVKYWKIYDEGLCNRRGNCLLKEDKGVCDCERGFQGDFCQTKSQNIIPF